MPVQRDERAADAYVVVCASGIEAARAITARPVPVIEPRQAAALQAIGALLA